MAVDDLGMALTGPVQVPPQNPLANAFAFLEDPGARAAILSAGLQLMQPVGVGQTPLGQVGQAIGKAGETINQREKMDLEQDAQDTKLQALQQKMDIAQQRLGLAQQSADERASARAQRLQMAEQRLQLAQQSGTDKLEIARAKLELERLRREDLEKYRGRSGDQKDRRLDQHDRGLDQGDDRLEQTGRGKGITAIQEQARLDRLEKEHNRQIDSFAKAAQDAQENIELGLSKNSPYARFKGMTYDQIREIYAKERPFIPPSATPPTAPTTTPAPAIGSSSSAPVQAQIPPDGTTATNPKTGERMIVRNGAWVKL